MRKPILLIFILATFNFCLGQSFDLKKSQQNLIADSMPLFYPNKEYQNYNFYFKDNVFYMSCEVQAPVLDSEIGATSRNILYNGSKNLSYSIADRFMGLENAAFLHQLKKYELSEYIYFDIYILKRDFTRTRYLFYVKVEELIRIQDYFNKTDFFEILGYIPS